MVEFEAMFGDSNKARTSANKLRRLQQGTRSAIIYASEFRQLAYDVNWGEAALIDQFRCGLRDDVQDLLLTLANLSSFSEIITQAIRCDNRLFKRWSPEGLVPRLSPFITLNHTSPKIS
jgi:hypothetical protein